MMAGYVYDLAQLIHQQKLAPVTIVAHSLGGNIALRYAGLYPENVAKLVAIEGLGPSPEDGGRALRQGLPRAHARLDRRAARPVGPPAAPLRLHRGCLKRMQEENKHLSPEQARHLTQHGVNQNEDGTYSWKFDNYVRSWPPYDMTNADVEALWARITCPTLLVYGKESWASNPADDGRAQAFPQRRGRDLRGRRPLGAPRQARRVHGPARRFLQR